MVASARSVAAGTDRSSRLAGTGPGVVESASSLADGSRVEGTRDRDREEVRVDLGDLRERQLAGRLQVRPEVADAGSRVEMRRTTGADHRLGVVADSCLGADVAVRRTPVEKCTLEVAEELQGHLGRRHIRLTWLEECELLRWMVVHSPQDLGKKFDLELG